MTDHTHRQLTDEQLSQAAASRPGYATYPEYQPDQPERLAWHWRDDIKPPVDVHRAPAAPAAPAPSTAAGVVTDRQLPARIGRFVPSPIRIPGRPWWRPRWHWLVATREGIHTGYTWTESGAHRLTARYSSKAAGR
ncbi:hypothetical protein GA0074692_6762 [Micromonospora pallida]|uniref:Uncharacterized protein n=1 Tax=Micromonospora pallida TaxID=145854 RepID=A0A1C6TNM7_9ACTN|nr:hypothetical protein [Micromonospora pallida]SCL43202.1 hypothetical protein GA0074692_6762 [Micromonospora pallida]